MNSAQLKSSSRSLWSHWEYMTGNALLAWTWGLLLIDGWKLFLTLHLCWDAKCTSLAPNSLDLDRMQSQMGGAAGMQTPTTGMSGMSGYSQMGPGPAPQHQGAYMGQMSNVQMRQQHLRQQQQLMALQQQQQQQQQQQVRPSLAVGGVNSCRHAGQVRWGIRDTLVTHIPLPVVFLSSFLCPRPLLHSNRVGGLPWPALSREFLFNHQPLYSDLLWWCISWGSRSVMQKNWIALFKVKVTVRAYMIKIWLFWLYLPN